MKTIFWILTLLTYQLTATSQEVNVVNLPDKMSAEEMAVAEAEYALWFNQLNLHFLSSTDPYDVSLGLAAILSGTLNDLSKQPDNQQLKDNLNNHIKILNGIIQQDKLSAATLELLLNWCFKKEIATQCHQDALLDKQLQLTPDNLNVYLKPLALAIARKDQALIDKIIALMSETKYNHSTQYITESFSDKIDEYVKNNPIPESAITAFKDDKALLDGVADDIKANLDQRIKDYFPASIKMSYVYLFNNADGKPLYDMCKNRADLFKKCVNITQILINDSNTIQFKGLGYVMLMAMHERMGEQQLLGEVLSKQEKYKANIQCLTKATQTTHFMDNFLDPKYQAINLLPIKEIKKLELLATYVYQKNKSTNPKLRDPSTCHISNP